MWAKLVMFFQGVLLGLQRGRAGVKQVQNLGFVSLHRAANDSVMSHELVYQSFVPNTFNAR